MRHLLFILLTLSFTIVGAQEIELAVGIDSVVLNPSDQFHDGRYMEPLSLNGDTTKGKKQNLYYRVGKSDWAKIDRKSRKGLCKLLSKTPDTYFLYKSYGKQLRKSKRIFIGTIVTSGAIYFAPGGRILVFGTLGAGTAWSYKERKEAQGQLVDAVSIYNGRIRRLNNTVPKKRPVVAHY